MDALQLANSAFAVDMFKQLCEKEPMGNVLFSPICLSTSLSLAQVGAKGDTANEIGQVLHFENVKDVPFGFQTVTSDVNKLSSFYSLKLVKRLYVDKSLNPSMEFISSTKRPYAKEMETVDFKDKLEETKSQINNSIKDLTDGKYLVQILLQIPELAAALPSSHESLLNIWKLLSWLFLVHRLISYLPSHASNLDFWALVASSHHLSEVFGATVGSALLYSLMTCPNLWSSSYASSKEFISSTKRPYAKEMETVDFKDKLEETKSQINNSIKDLTDGKYLVQILLQIPELAAALPSSHESLLNIWKLLSWLFLVHRLISYLPSHASNLDFWALVASSHHLSEVFGATVGSALLYSLMTCPNLWSSSYASSKSEGPVVELRGPAFCSVLPQASPFQDSSSLSEMPCRFENILADNSVSDQTKILVVNAAYFVGKWMKKFPESETKECPFRVNKTDTKPVQMMNMEATFCMGNIDDINCKIIELPFQNKHLSMLILLPKDVEDESTGLEKIEKQLNSETLLKWTNPSTMANAKVKLSIPKFKVEKIIDPKGSLENLGLKNIFNENASDFSGMSETKGVALSNVIHRVCLEITEDGGDSIEVPGSRILQHKDELKADHPFIYIIRHNKTRNIIFFGKFCSP
ncbi:Serpin B5 [Tupaia chinensis]|uniref:Serpin B5 n=1 Tax=Tupaia chinensis TaxID=246437 RepID=L9L820_TUPCH|nr:Serpin B5 [Tupaia chinensis]